MKATNKSANDSRGEIVLDRRSLDSITSYEVTDEQLTIIENNTSSNELNFAISLISISVSLIVTLLTTRIESPTKVAVFWSIMSVTAILGGYFTFQYRKSRMSSKNIFTKIRSQKSTSAIRDYAEASIPVTTLSDEQSFGAEND